MKVLTLMSKHLSMRFREVNVLEDLLYHKMKVYTILKLVQLYAMTMFGAKHSHMHLNQMMLLLYA